MPGRTARIRRRSVTGRGPTSGMRVLTINAGSSSLKASIVDGQKSASATLDWEGSDRAATLTSALARLDVDPAGIEAVVHRVVHGGERLTGPVVIDDAVAEQIAAVGELAPLHNDIALETLSVARALIANRPHVACFDTAFHAGLPEVATRYPVPVEWQTRWGVRRFGFHGLSVEWSVGRTAELLGRPAGQLELVVAHLGSGCSVTAVSGGSSVWTSMGFTPLDGLMMRTRSGAIDPGILIHLLRRGALDVEELAAALEQESGLLGVGGGRGDVRDLERAAADGDRNARLALDMFAGRAAAGIAAAATSLERIDAVVFTGGIGEHAGPLRAGIVVRLGVLGVAPIDTTENGKDRVLGAGPPAVVRVEAREDLVMARAATVLLAAGGPSASRG
jgi:acetate kinase